MDRVEESERERSDDRLGERDQLDDRLGDRDGKTQRVSDGETEKEVSAMPKEYDMGLSDRDDERSPSKLEIASGYRPTLVSPTLQSLHPLSPYAMDISSVCFRPKKERKRTSAKLYSLS